MKKFLAILAVAALSACGNSGPADEPAPYEEDPQSVSNQNLDSDILRQSISDRDLARCENIIDELKRSECSDTIDSLTKSEAAIEAKDEAGCSEIPLERYRENCVASVKSAIAKDSERDSKLAELGEMTGEAESLTNTAIENGDAAVCDGIEDANLRSSCQYNAVSASVLESKNFALCEVIDDVALRSQCEQL